MILKCGLWRQTFRIQIRTLVQWKIGQMLPLPKPLLPHGAEILGEMRYVKTLMLNNCWLASPPFSSSSSSLRMNVRNIRKKHQNI